MKTREIELTFLARFIPAEIKGVTPLRLSDIYIPEDSDFPVLRVRQLGDTYEITKKIPLEQGDFSRHIEHTIALNVDEYKALMGTSKRSVEKDRYKVVIDGYEAEVDIFDGKLAGLVMLDFEFKSEAAMKAFIPPKCCLADVTQEKFILGGDLAAHTYEEIAADLKRYNYKKLTRENSRD